LSTPVGNGGSVLVEETPAGAGGGGVIRAGLSAADVDGIDELPDRLRVMGGGGGGMPMLPLSESDDPVPKPSVVRKPMIEFFGWGLPSGACVESDVAGSEADVCWTAVSVIGLEPQLELKGVPPVLTAGGIAFFMLSTPPAGVTDPPVAEPVGIGDVMPPEDDVVAGAMVAGVLFHACGAPAVPAGLVGVALACAPDCVCDGLLTMLRMFPD
jgi:hypothetical protein